MLLVNAALIVALPGLLCLLGRRDLLRRFGVRSLLIGMLALACLFALARLTNSERMRVNLVVPLGATAIYLAPLAVFVTAAVRSMEAARRVGLAMLMSGLVICQVAMLSDLPLPYAGWTSFEYLHHESRELGWCFLGAALFFVPWERTKQPWKRFWANLQPGSPLDGYLSGQKTPRDLPQSLGIAEGHARGEDRQHEDKQPGGDADQHAPEQHQ